MVICLCPGIVRALYWSINQVRPCRSHNSMLPKLSTRLKNILLGETPRDEIYESFHQRSVLSTLSEQAKNTDTFTLETFLSRDFSSDYISRIRREYSSFLSLANDLTNGSSQQHDAAKVLYNMINRAAAEQTAYAEVTSYIGPIPEALFHQVFEKARFLHEAAGKASKSSSSQLMSSEYVSSLQIHRHRLSFNDARFSSTLDFLEHPTNLSSSSSSAAKASESPELSTALWLLTQSRSFSQTKNAVLSGEQLADEIVKMISSLSSKLSSDVSIAEALQSKLFDLVGEDGFDFMGEIFQNLSSLKTVTSAILEKAKNQSILPTTAALSNHQSSARNSYFDGEAVGHSQGELLTALGFTGEYLAQERALGLHGGRMHSGVADVRTTLSAIGGGVEYHEKRGLPAGTKRTTFQGYEEVFMPAPARPAKANANELVAIESLESWAQLAFPDTKHLNRIQSTVFETAYHSSENMLICAPTGAGKTNIAMLAFLQLVKQHIVDGSLLKDRIKAIYIAPMKALAQEVVTKFSARLAPLGLVVKEYTGDMQLTKAEVAESHLLVSTPEKYDVVTRKGGDGSLGTLISLLIIDEVHLLADDRGAVIETIVARTQRYVESSQKVIRLVGLSATLPNYTDVAMFLGVNLRTGLYHFGSEYRPVPLDQSFIGVTEKQKAKRLEAMNRICYEKILHALNHDKQVMIFVHSRKETSSTAQAMLDLASRNGTLNSHFQANVQNHDKFSLFKTEADKSKNQELTRFFYSGFGIHHAGMLRSDRNLTETMFEQGLIRVLCCTATLAWGVNLPAHTVIIKGTEIYDPSRGGFVDLSMLDVLQIFGRAGRPQYDDTGHAILITPHASLAKYLSLFVEQMPIESGLIRTLPDHLNAEIVNGTIQNLQEAIRWLSYTFLYIRMCKNPMVYGISYEERLEDARLERKRMTLIQQAAMKLDACRMIRYDLKSGNLAVTDLGRIASHYYIQHPTIERFNQMLASYLDDRTLIKILCSSQEFQQLKVRPEEIPELDGLTTSDKVSSDEISNKVSILLESYLEHRAVRSFTLQSDTNYIATNSSRICRALFEICLRRGWSTLTYRYLTFAKAIDRHLHWNQHPIRQFENEFPAEVYNRIEGSGLSIDDLLELNPAEVNNLLHSQKHGSKLLQTLRRFPRLSIESTIQPLTRGILRIEVTVRPNFTWFDRYHQPQESFWIWIEDSDQEYIYHSETVSISRRVILSEEPILLEIMIPVKEPLPSQYYLRCISDRWLGSQATIPLSFQHLLLPDRMPPHTSLLDVHPIPVSALQDPSLSSLYPFTHFNPVQSHVFHVLYHTDTNALIGAPTGSGKTILAEFALYRLWQQKPTAKAIYIAPLKALAKERSLDWQRKFASLGRRVEELTGEITPDLVTLKQADVYIVTPEKWDSISRGWKRRDYVQAVELVILDEVHLLGVDRGPVLEVLVSRMRLVSSQMNHPIRFIGLSTALANPRDLADWLGIEDIGLYNFHPSVRPIPMTIHITGFPGKHYCPRMATMNKPCYAAILEHSPTKPVLIFVSSRRQTRLTALDLISYAAADDQPNRFLHQSQSDMQAIATTIEDASLRDLIIFGIGIHHAGLSNHDRSIIEELFSSRVIQVLVCTSTLAWGVNLPCHLVIVKGTEYYDGKLRHYKDMPVTDVLQMMGRAGRPQFDDTGIACIFVYEPKKHFYRKFLHEPFPVESSLHLQLHEHLNAEIASGALTNIADCVEYLSWTYFFRRLIMNPTYYRLYDTSIEGLSTYLIELIRSTLQVLVDHGCIESVSDQEAVLEATVLGKITSYYYLHYQTAFYFQQQFESLASSFSLESILKPQPVGDDSLLMIIIRCIKILCEATEFAELPVRHNEDLLNAKLASQLPWYHLEKSPDDVDYSKASVKACLLIQAYVYNAQLPIADYINDTKSILDQLPRVLNAMIDVAADSGYLHIVIILTRISQMIVQAMPYKMTTTAKSLAFDMTVALEGSEVRVTLQRNRGQADGKVTGTRYPRAKTASYWLIVAQEGELLALKRVGEIKKQSTISLDVEVSHPTADLQIYLLNDSFMMSEQILSLSINHEKQQQR
jgi:activating signal cointegrator complex subunit 3